MQGSKTTGSKIPFAAWFFFVIIHLALNSMTERNYFLYYDVG